MGVSIYSALGTPLEWPEAKKNANHVRDWGIKVYIYPNLGVVGWQRLTKCAAITGDME